MKTAKILFDFKYISHFLVKTKSKHSKKSVFGSLELSFPVFNYFFQVAFIHIEQC